MAPVVTRASGRAMRKRVEIVMPEKDHPERRSCYTLWGIPTYDFVCSLDFELNKDHVLRVLSK